MKYIKIRMGLSKREKAAEKRAERRAAAKAKEEAVGQHFGHDNHGHDHHGQVSNIGLGSLKAFSSDDCELNEELVTEKSSSPS